MSAPPPPPPNTAERLRALAHEWQQGAPERHQAQLAKMIEKIGHLCEGWAREGRTETPQEINLWVVFHKSPAPWRDQAEYYDGAEHDLKAHFDKEGMRATLTRNLSGAPMLKLEWGPQS